MLYLEKYLALLEEVFQYKELKNGFAPDLHIHIFLKSKVEKKIYNFSFIIDLSQSAVLLCNYSHVITTIILLLIAPSTVEDNKDIFIDFFLIQLME